MFSVTCAVIWPGRSDRMPVIRAAEMTAPACRIFGDAGAATRSAATVRRSGAALRKAVWRSCADGVAGGGARPSPAREGPGGGGVAGDAAGERKRGGEGKGRAG